MNKKIILIIFDDSLNINSFKHRLKKLRVSTADKILLFPLASNYDLIQDVTELFKISKYINFEIVNSSLLINDEINKIKARVAEWSTEVGLKKIDGKTLREWFAINEKLSIWWFSLIAEKNTLKTDIFLQIAQICAIDKFLCKLKVDACIVFHKNLYMKKAIYSILDKHNIRYDKLHFINLLHFLICFSSLTYGFVKGIGYWMKRVLRTFMAKAVLSSTDKCIDNKYDIVFITYFPVIDRKQAENGIFINKMAQPLQQKLKEMDKKVKWIAMYIFYDNIAYFDALRLIKFFRKNGEAIIILDEFSSLQDYLKTFYIWIRSCIIYLKIRNKIDEKILCFEPIPKESYFLIKKILDWSLAGWISMAGLIFFMQFKRMYVTTKGTSKYIYYTEMQEWEKALNYAKAEVSDKAKNIGFQHTNIADNLFHYLWTAQDLSANHSYPLPFPDVFVCNGTYPFEYIRKNGAKNITIAESIRYLYLSSLLNESKSPHKKKKVILFAGSINYKETKAILSFIKASNIYKEKDIEIWLKGHPSCPLDKMLRELDFQIGKSSKIILCSKPIDELLKEALIVIVGSSTVAVEALASCCNVVIPILPDIICANPLSGFENLYYKVFTPQELRKIVSNILEKQIQPSPEKVHEMLKYYWCLDTSLKRWQELLS